MTKAADDCEAIRRRLEEIEAEQKLALTGSSAPTQEQPKEIESVYGYGGGIDYCALKSSAHLGWPYAGTGFEWRKFVRS
jgi:hypothetical protein